MLERVREEVDAYLRRHPQEQQRLCGLRDQLEDDVDPFVRSNMAGHITSSVLVFDAGFQHVLLIHHKVYINWMQPGGHVEADSFSLLDSGLREVEEETGLPVADVQPLLQGRVLDIDTHDIAARTDKGEVAHRHHDFLYLAVAMGPFVPQPQLEEVNDVAWVPIDDFLAIPGQRMQHLVPKLRCFLMEAQKARAISPSVPASSA
jgi:8-oxo-dGTP pyrophosphatase MutT (NUDIX family)